MVSLPAACSSSGAADRMPTSRGAAPVGPRRDLARGKAVGTRRVEGRDIVSWLVETPFLEQAVEDLPSPWPVLPRTSRPPAATAGETSTTGLFSPTA